MSEAESQKRVSFIAAALKEKKTVAKYKWLNYVISSSTEATCMHASHHHPEFMVIR